MSYRQHQRVGPEAAAADHTIEEHIRLQASAEGQPTDIMVAADSLVRIYAYGKWSHGTEGTDLPYYGPAGYDKSHGSDFPDPEANVGALVCKVGDGPWLCVGEGRVFRSDRPGKLYLSMNDEWGGFGNNRGYMNVTVSVTQQ